MGEGGVSPEYFHLHMTYCEAGDFLAGMQRRYRQGWEQTRLSVDVAARCAGNKDGVDIRFPWDEDTRVADVSNEDIGRMKEEAREWERIMNSKT